VSRHATASFAVGVRRAGLIAGLTVIACLVGALGAGSASALAPEPTVTFEGVEDGYTSAHVKFTMHAVPNVALFYALQYTTNLSANVEESEWLYAEFGGGDQTYPYEKTLFGQSSYTANEIAPNLKPGTKYQYRIIVLQYGEVEYEGEFRFPASPEPGPFFEAKPVAKPVVDFESISEVTLESAHFDGTVNSSYPGGLSPEGEAAYQTHWEYSCQPVCPDLKGGDVGPNDPITPVSVDATRLEANTFYEVTLTATNKGGSTIVEKTFSTPAEPPAVVNSAGASDGRGGYTLEGTVTPYNSRVTDCHFEYGPTTAYVYKAPCSPTPTGRDEVQRVNVSGAEGQFRLAFRGSSTGDLDWGISTTDLKAALEALPTIGAGGILGVEREDCFFCTSFTITFGGPNLASTNLGPLKGSIGTIPLRTAPTGEDTGPPSTTTLIDGGNNLPVLVEAQLNGLTVGNTYHFRLVATTNVGTVASGDLLFTPTLAPPPPDCPNNQQRAENRSTDLPECRAYEMVTAPNKSSADATLEDYTEDGKSLAFTTVAGNIDQSGQGRAGFPGNLYVTNREDAGWQTIKNLNGPTGSLFTGPESLQFSGSSPSIYSADLQTSLWYTYPGAPGPGAGNRPYLRNEEGKFVEVGRTPGLTGGSGLLGVGNSFDWGYSDDLSHIAINGEAPPFGSILGPGVYEWVGTGDDLPERIDVKDNGEPISKCGLLNFTGAAAFGNTMSRDGRAAVFTATGGSFCSAPDSPPENEVWVRIDSKHSYDASESHCTRTAGDPGGACNAPAPATFKALSEDGKHILFSTEEQLVNGDTDQTNDLYVYDLPTEASPDGKLTEVSGARPKAVTEETSIGFTTPDSPRISPDGSTVYFIAGGVLADNEDALGNTAVEGDHNLYVWRRDAAHPDGQTKFITRLLNSEIQMQDSEDGRYMVLTTTSPIVPTDTDNSRDVFRYDADSGELVRVSVNTAGIGGNGDNRDATIAQAAPTHPPAAHHINTAITRNGEMIAFSSPEQLSPQDGNELSDVYLWSSGKVHMITSGGLNGGGREARLTGSGRDLFFQTSEPLTQADPDLAVDVYDARIDGGFTFRPVPTCSGEGCQGAAAGPAQEPPPGTGGSGPGNVDGVSATLSALSKAERKAFAGSGRTTLRLSASAPGQLDITGTARVGGKRRPVFAASLYVERPGDVSVPISLTKKARKQLRRDGKLAIEITVEFGDAKPKTSALVLKK
jgi:hypothetical protein